MRDNNPATGAHAAVALEHRALTALRLFERGDEAFKRGRWKNALFAFAGVVEACPGHVKARFRVADALLNIGRRDLALSVYRAISWHSIKAGHPLMGLVAAKMVTLLDPAADDVLIILAELYSNESDRVDVLYDGPALVMPGEEPAAMLDEDDDAPAGGVDELLEEAAHRAASVDGSLPYPRHLPPIPLFSYLDEDSFIAVLGKLRLRRFADEEVIIRQGERGDSFFMIADGSVLVKRDIDDDDGGVTLAHLHRGSVFGELALISDEPRHANVVARGDVDVLELRRSDLIVAAAQLEGISTALKLFTRERFLRNLTATHSFFQGLSRDERHRVMESFKVVNFRAGDVLIEEAQRGPGLFVLLGGAANVAKRQGSRDGERIHLATLRGGDLCGEMSMINDAPTNATVTADADLEALFLSREEFKAVVAEHPELMKYLAGLTDERLRQNRALLHTRGLLEDDEHVMI
ncbi:MAG: cyclic nucleotide-binding domain-containing protein [Deltaproteobacteria bacterium]|nr:cyclic nucleotide-binding domain-containing protein [Deltaproteobacteria bacterium]